MSSNVDMTLVNQLEDKSYKIRKDLLNFVYHIGMGHLGGELSIVEMAVALYYKYMNYDPKNPKWEDRDRLVLSKGHCGETLYCIYSDLGMYTMDYMIEHFESLDTAVFGQHPNRKYIPAIEVSCGSLGHGLSWCCGIGHANRGRGIKSRIWTLLGDGEMEEGSNWEAILYAASHNLDNIVAVVDFNHASAAYETNQNERWGEKGGPEGMADCFRAFGWNATVIDGTDMKEIDKTLAALPEVTLNGICSTTKGQGVGFMMERPCAWHIGGFDDDKLAEAEKDIKEYTAKKLAEV